MALFDLSRKDKAFLRQQFEEVRVILSRIEEILKKMPKELDDLTAQVAENTNVEQSALILIQGLAQKLQDAINAGNPAALTALQTQLKTSSDALAAAVAANTPAAPTN